ncbi:translation initiation factor IF-2-like [Zalophus californianus]|uniref:Translation initiation factor IF-2-like n=1 Tax=Zalophus californianus TaxID=9704 RepID=A0A6J2BLE4_ZALCA|nr:translation initiation factor IF-2-like [Zalophus californianus]
MAAAPSPQTGPRLAALLSPLRRPASLPRSTSGGYASKEVCPSCKCACHLPSRPPGGAGAQPKGARARGEEAEGSAAQACARAPRLFPGPLGARAASPAKREPGRGRRSGGNKRRRRRRRGAHGGGSAGLVPEPGGRWRRRTLERAGGGGGRVGPSPGRAKAAAERRRCGPGLRVFGAEERWQRLHFLLHFHPWGEEKEGAIPTTPPLSLAGKKKKKRRARRGGPPAPPALHVRTRIPGPGRPALQTFHFLCAERPPLTQPRMHVPPSLFIHPPPQLRSPRFLPPLPIPQLRQCWRRLSPRPAPASPPRPRGRGLQSQPPRTNANEAPSQQTSSYCPSLPAESGGERTGGRGEGPRGADLGPPACGVHPF